MQLSERQTEILERLSRGETQKEIAREMGRISPRTVQTQILRLRYKLAARTIGEAISIFATLRITQIPVRKRASAKN